MGQVPPSGSLELQAEQRLQISFIWSTVFVLFYFYIRIPLGEACTQMPLKAFGIVTQTCYGSAGVYSGSQISLAVWTRQQK